MAFNVHTHPSLLQIKAETYQPMPSYRLCTADGVLQLTPGLSSYLKRVLLAQTTLN